MDIDIEVFKDTTIQVKENIIQMNIHTYADFLGVGD